VFSNRVINNMNKSSSSSSSAQDTTEGCGSSTWSTSEVGCVSNTFEPEEPEIKREVTQLLGQSAMMKYEVPTNVRS
jgi:hypothetical protein